MVERWEGIGMVSVMVVVVGGGWRERWCGIGGVVGER
jgi:hypothetical protein